MENFSKNLNIMRFPIFYPAESETILPAYSLSQDRKWKHVAIAVTAKVEFDDRPLPQV